MYSNKNIYMGKFSDLLVARKMLIKITMNMFYGY